jgi:hypothetical protein
VHKSLLENWDSLLVISDWLAVGDWSLSDDSSLGSGYESKENDELRRNTKS